MLQTSTRDYICWFSPQTFDLLIIPVKILNGETSFFRPTVTPGNHVNCSLKFVSCSKRSLFLRNHILLPSNSSIGNPSAYKVAVPLEMVRGGIALDFKSCSNSVNKVTRLRIGKMSFMGWGQDSLEKLLLCLLKASDSYPGPTQNRQYWPWYTWLRHSVHTFQWTSFAKFHVELESFAGIAQLISRLQRFVPVE